MTREELKDRIRASIAFWMEGEYDEPYEEALESVQGDVFGVAYCQYDDGEVCVDEQWMVDLNEGKLYLELNGREYHAEYYNSLEDMEDAFAYGLDFDELIGEADDWVERWKEDFK